jgi:hypothetical protein
LPTGIDTSPGDDPILMKAMDALTSHAHISPIRFGCRSSEIPPAK